VQQSASHEDGIEIARTCNVINSPIYDCFLGIIQLMKTLKTKSATMAQDSTNSNAKNTVHEIESEFHGHEGPQFDSYIASRAVRGTLRPRLEGQSSALDHYFQEIQRVTVYLTRCVDRLQYLREEDVDVFEDARKYHRYGTGEDPLRAWEVKMLAMVGMLRDIQDEGLQGAGLDTDSESSV
jgi:hypothetical protein